MYVRGCRILSGGPYLNIAGRLANGICLGSIPDGAFTLPWGTPFCFAKRSRGTRTPSVALRLPPRAVRQFVSGTTHHDPSFLSTGDIKISPHPSRRHSVICDSSFICLINKLLIRVINKSIQDKYIIERMPINRAFQKK